MSKPTCSDALPEEVRAEFDRLVSILEGRASAVDAFALEMLAASIVLWRRSVCDVAKDGAVVMSGGVAIANPNIMVGERAQGQILAIMKEIGASALLKRRMLHG